ncbi:serine-rich coiled-coil domain-containing protein 1-like isoform X3 [Acipenser ruthenus]|uniref:serine-rich coiled-coil domain-containing protein 1-like isoform X3 n=1 Tax=Acipenser ruthenus TaxID=7906 RepID=UPI0027416B21|nr:serine-rich coiled-coil domain-containing protein 1-like isoform X3 [Acipenser ruthenus]
MAGRSTLVSRLPIFRRSTGKKQDSLPSSPSSGNANGVHTSSPSSTNSSSSSTGKRRNIFRSSSIGFHSKKHSNHKLDTVEAVDLSQHNGSQAADSSFQKVDLEESIKSKSRHSFGFGGHRGKKITRSQTEDFEKGKEQATNRNVFTNCISSGTNEGDDSGFLDDYSKRSSKHSSKKLLLPKSFSSHYKLSKQCQYTSVVEQPRDIAKSAGMEPTNVGTPGSCPGEIAECSLQSPMLSTDHTTAHTPSEFIPITEDSVSEADVLPNCSPAVSHVDNFGHDVTTSQVFINQVTSIVGSNSLLCKENSHQAETSTVNTESAVTVLRKDFTILDIDEESLDTDDGKEISGQEEKVQVHAQVLEVTNPESDNPQKIPIDQTEVRVGNKTSDAIMIQEASQVIVSLKPDLKTCHPRNTHAVALASSLSPYRDVIRMERRLRSSSESTAGSARLHLNLRDVHTGEISSLQKQKANSSSSKLDSLDVLNNLGSCELDEDDLMLDLDFPEDQRHRFVCREDSNQSIASCLALMHSPMETSIDKIPGRDPKALDTTHGAISVQSQKDIHLGDFRPSSSCLPGVPLTDWCLPREDEIGGLEALPFRLMMQDCTAVKTLLLRLKRILQEQSTEMSPASSIHSLPVSPGTEKQLLSKDVTKDERSSLMLQLKEKDDLILKLQDELAKAQSLQKSVSHRMDKSTQTEIIGHDKGCYRGIIDKHLILEGHS